LRVQVVGEPTKDRMKNRISFLERIESIETKITRTVETVYDLQEIPGDRSSTHKAVHLNETVRGEQQKNISLVPCNALVPCSVSVNLSF
jgi:hypothetical protein